MSRQNFKLEVQHHFKQAGIDLGPAPVDASAHECREYTLRQRVAGHHVGNRKPHRNRRVGRAPCQPKQAGARLRQKVLPREILPRPVFAVAGYRAVNDSRVDRLDVVIAESAAFNDAGPEILDHDVSSLEQFDKPSAIVGVSQIGCYAFLVPVYRVEQRIVASDLGIGQVQMSAKIADAGPFHLYDARAEVGELQPAQGSGKELAEIDDQQSVKRPFALRQRFHRLVPTYEASRRSSVSETETSLRRQACTMSPPLS